MDQDNVLAGRRNRRMGGSSVDLGFVTAPSGTLVLGMAGQMDQWRVLGRPLSERAREAAALGGGHLRDWLCEAVAVPAAKDQRLSVRARTSPSPFDGKPTIATLEVQLGLPWVGTRQPETPIQLGDLPVDRTGMVVGDASGLDAWTGLSSELAETVPADFSRSSRAGRDHLLLRFGAIQVGGCPVLGMHWCQGDHSMRHRGERAAGRVYPVTIEADAVDRTVPRWTIPRYSADHGGRGR
ncbi:hypothetical protein [Streptomyces thermolilacinus]|nr:hypothetical protein [Streptomyces thermolilacinus]